MHEDNTPNNINNIIKYIALKINNGNSFSIQRSYPMSFKGVFASYYNNDYFFCWGNHSIKLFKDMLNINNEYINTGFSFSSRDNNKVKDKIKSILVVKI